ncbi:MAG: hypothetical protein ACOC8N_03525 [Spirochaetota bacterium]
MNRQSDGGGARDRAGWLVFFGALEILFGILVLLMLIGMGVGAAAGGLYPLTGPMLVYMLVFYGILAGFFITMGVGTASVKRWARSVMIVVSWFWLAFGVLGAIAAALVIPPVIVRMAPEMPVALPVLTLLVTGFMVLLMVLAPLLLVLVYGGSRVRSTFMRRDPNVYWTERVPTPVLSLALLLGFSGLMLLVYQFAAFPFPLFGTWIPGAWARVLWVLFGLAFAGSGWLSYRMDGRGWLAGASLIGFLVASTFLTYQRAGVWELYAGMSLNIPPDLLSGPLFQRLYLLTMAPVTAFYAGYFAWVRRFFPRLLPGTAGRAR